MESDANSVANILFEEFIRKENKNEGMEVHELFLDFLEIQKLF
jgi:hypothetical protein